MSKGALARFEELLIGYTRGDAKTRREAEQRMWDDFGRCCAVFVSDLSGFSRLTARYSIIHFLALIHECRRLLLPVIEEGGGSPIKATADNMYATFPSASKAIAASIAMQRRLQKYNASRHPDEQIGLCVGIGFGKILVIDQVDFFGHELNLAFKLGEDTAVTGEILATEAALKDAQGFESERRTVTLSGVTIPHAAILYE